MQVELMALAVVGFLRLPSRLLGQPLALLSNCHLGHKEVGGKEIKRIFNVVWWRIFSILFAYKLYHVTKLSLILGALYDIYILNKSTR